MGGSGGKNEKIPQYVTKPLPSPFTFVVHLRDREFVPLLRTSAILSLFECTVLQTRFRLTGVRHHLASTEYLVHIPHYPILAKDE